MLCSNCIYVISAGSGGCSPGVVLFIWCMSTISEIKRACQVRASQSLLVYIVIHCDNEGYSSMVLILGSNEEVLLVLGLLNTLEERIAIIFSEDITSNGWDSSIHDVLNWDGNGKILSQVSDWQTVSLIFQGVLGMVHCPDGNTPQGSPSSC